MKCPKPETEESVIVAERKKFSHQPLSGDKHEIRLIKLVPSAPQPVSSIEVDLKHFRLEDVLQHRVEYIALSYTWGSDEDLQSISMNGASFEVRANLHAFLVEMQKRNESGYFWVDQLCIDQQTTRERNHQVQLMPQIYSSASAVYAWLGSAFDSSSLAMNVLQRYEDLAKSSLDTGSSIEEFWESKILAEQVAFLRLMGLPYWSRVWIVQEVSLARTLFLLCGSDTVHVNVDVFGYRYYCASTKYMDSLYRPLQAASSHVSRRTWEIATNAWDLLHIKLWCQKYTPLGEPPLLTVTEGMDLSAQRACLDPRDRIFGIQACIFEESRITVDYGMSVEEVFTKFERQSLGKSKLLIGSLSSTLVALRDAMGLRCSRRLMMEAKMRKWWKNCALGRSVWVHTGYPHSWPYPSRALDARLPPCVGSKVISHENLV